MLYTVGTTEVSLNPADLAGDSWFAPSASVPLQANVGEPELSPAPPGPLSQHIPALDAIRGLAIVLVTVYRFGAMGVDFTLPGMHWFELLKPLNKGVDLFFVLSGFLITGILFDAKTRPHYFRDFYARRSLRIFPLYYGSLLLCLVILPGLGLISADLFAPASAQQAWLWLYGTNVLQGIQGEWSLGGFNHFWSLAVEEHFYLVWPLVIFLLTRRQALWACGGLVLFSLVTRTLYTYLYGAQAADVGAETFTWMRLDSLALGGWVALAARGPNGIRALLPLAKGALACSLLLLLALVWRGQHRALHLPFTLFAIFFAGLLVCAVAATRESWLGQLGQNKVLRFFGKYSYGMYVFQNILLVLVASWLSPAILTQQLGSPVAGQLVYLGAMFGLTTLVALASWHLFEKHFMRLKKYFEAGNKTSA